MTYTDATSVFLAPGEAQDISEDYWEDVLDRAGSYLSDPLWAPFAADERPNAARQLYRLVTEARQRASYWLAKPFEEHSAGTNQSSVLWRHKTRSWGNATSVRHPSLPKMIRGRDGSVAADGWELVHDDFRGRDYVRYVNVIDSMKDALFRITDPTFVYVQEGRRTVRQVGERFVGLSENTDNYVAGLVRRMNQYISEDKPMAGDDSRFRWMPDVSEFGYPKGSHGRAGFSIDLGIVHYTQGTNSSAWLRGNNGSSTHYLTDRAMRPFEQHVREADAAWTAGNKAFNLRGINVEGELPGDQWTPALIRELAKTTYPIWKRHDIPLVYLGRDNGPGKRGLIGHADVPDQDHTDPGSTFDWPLYIAELRKLDGTTVDDRILVVGNPLGAFGYRLGFKQRLQQIGAAVSPTNIDLGILAWAGWATADEYGADDGCSYQVCERGVLKYEPSIDPPFDIVMMHRGVEPPPPKGARDG